MYDWRCFTQQLFINAAPEAVFRAWTQPEQLERWFIAEATYTTAEGRLRYPNESIDAGDTYRWRWHQPYHEEGRVLAVGPGLTCQFTFGELNNDAPEPILVTITCHPDGEDTRLELTQDKMPDTIEAQHSWHMGCSLGWSFFMTNLKALLEHGVDLRETEPERAMVSRSIH